MKKTVIWSVLVIILVTINLMILGKENILGTSTTILLKLVPVDPRSLMQGDYMVLRYEIAQKIPASGLADEGCIVVKLDSNQVAGFVRMHDGKKLADGEHLLYYRNRKGLKIGAESFFFQEGDAGIYSSAKYGELQLEASGKCVLVGLRDGDYKRLGKTR